MLIINNKLFEAHIKMGFKHTITKVYQSNKKHGIKRCKRIFFNTIEV